MNTSIRHSRLRRTAAIALLATLAVRAIVPLGYMPGSLLDGELMVLCPVASAATFEFLRAEPSHEHEHDHGESGDTVASIDLACPIGSSLFFDAIPSLEYPQLVASQSLAVAPIIEQRWHVRTPRQIHLARGPPKS